MDFTKEQALAISLRGEDIMVSAGAGAGKTRVLVSRIADLVSDPDLSMDIDQILVMTFTNAAAAEMKERISQEIADRLLDHPEDQNLRRQNRLLRKAQVSTVHSFCNTIIRTHYQMLGIDPAYRLGEEGEMKLLQMEVVGQVLEESYLEGSEDFLRFVETWAPGKRDSVLEDCILSLYRFSRSFPDVDYWYKQVLEETGWAVCGKEGCSQVLRQFVEEGSREFREAAESLDVLAQKYDFSTAPEKFRDHYFKVRTLLDGFPKDLSYEEYYAKLHAIDWPSFPVVRKAPDKDWPGKPVLKEYCDSVKKQIIERQRNSLFRCPPEDMVRENRTIYPMLKEYIRLAKRFEELYFDRKKDQNVYDFDDLEHMALSLLMDGFDEEGRPVPTDTAREIAGSCKAIFVDEYQDTSLIQETMIELLLAAGRIRLFTVGDVKQSIYRFRQARPDLFVARRNRYDSWENTMAEGEGSDGTPAGVRIELRDNFRSNPRVLWLVNQVFSRLMDADFGGVDYDKETELRAGENGPMAGETTPSECHFFVRDEDLPAGPDLPDRKGLDAAVIAKRIEGLIEEGYAYRDMVILLRSKNEIAEYAQWLESWGIPVFCENKTGYFASREISLMMNVLAIVDNVYQDIPMASVLLSTIGGFTEEDLIRLKLQVEIPCRRDYHFYDLLLMVLEQGEGNALWEKTKAFLKMLWEFRRKKKELPLGGLLWLIYSRTGYYDAVQLLPEGQQKKQNLLMLLEKAEEYEKTMYKGLFYFKRYMDQLRTYEIEPETAAGDGDRGNVVRLMTIHKSKGLEFPVVFVSGLSHMFNSREWSQDAIVFHPELGIGMDWTDPVLRYRHTSMMKSVIQKQLKKESLEEELRVLYVAMTRAEKKLILTGVVDRKKLDEGKDVIMNRSFKMAGRAFMDWLLPAVLDIPHNQEELQVRFAVWQDVEDRFADTVQKENAPDLWKFLESAVKEVDDTPVRRAFACEYPYRDTVGQKRKYSVSELKKLSQILLPGEDGRAGQAEYHEGEIPAGQRESDPQTEKLLPEFLKEDRKEDLPPAARGTLVHKMLELLPFRDIDSPERLSREITTLKAAYPDLQKIDGSWLERGAGRFLFSRQGEELRQLDKEGKLYKELPFTIGLTQDDLAGINHPGAAGPRDRGETIVVQGIIDLFAETKKGLWLLDYKTDFLLPGQERLLLDRYRTQMLYYKLALEQVWGKQVDRICLYSYSLGTFVTLTEDYYGSREQL